MSEELSALIRKTLDKARLDLDKAREDELSARLKREQAETDYELWQQLAETIK